MGVQGSHNRRYRLAFLAVFISLLILYGTTKWYEPYLYHTFKTDAFLSWHIGLEGLSVIMSFCIFLISYYTFDRTKKLRTLIISCTFLCVGILDAIHTLTYNGMPAFIIPTSIASATSFWILARLTAAIGLLLASMAKYDRTVSVNRHVCVGISLVYSGLSIYIFTRYLDDLPPLFIEGQGLTPLKIGLEYLIILLLFISMVFFYKLYKEEQGEEGFHFVIIALLFSIFSELVFTQYGNVYDTYNLLGHIYKVVAYYLIFKAKFILNIQKPYEALFKTERMLSQYADNLERLVVQRTAEITAANEKLLRDLDYAGNIQSALLPVSFPNIPQLDFAARYIPCEKIGGDFYNIYRLDDENIGILIGDVAGHGVSAAMITVFINQNIYVRREYDDGRVRVLTPKQVLNNLFHIYNRMTFPDEIYTVLFYGIYNLETKELTYSSAGMNMPPLILKGNGDVETIPIEGLPICKLGAFISPAYENHSIQLEDGDSMLFYTDGLVEVDRKKPEQFNEHNLVEYMKGVRGISAEDTAEYLLDLYYAILGDKQVIDDVTVLVIKIKELASKSSN